MRQLFVASAVAIALGSASLLGQADSKIYTAGDGVSLPVVVKSVRPDYTAEAMRQQIEGQVILTAVVRRDGRVTDVSVKKSLDAVYGLDQKAIEALRQWEFKPGTKDKEPVAVQIDIVMNFTLK